MPDRAWKAEGRRAAALCGGTRFPANVPTMAGTLRRPEALFSFDVGAHGTVPVKIIARVQARVPGDPRDAPAADCPLGTDFVGIAENTHLAVTLLAKQRDGDFQTDKRFHVASLAALGARPKL